MVTPTVVITETIYKTSDAQRGGVVVAVVGGREGQRGERSRREYDRPTASKLTPIPAAMSQEIEEALGRYHTHAIPPGRCGSVHFQDVAAALPVVWSLVRRFDLPQAYKRFVRECRVLAGDGGVGSVREVRLVSGLPAATSTERLDALDDDRHVFSFSIIGGDHRLANYRSVTTLHDSGGGCGETVVVESYVVDVPAGSTEEETCIFADMIVRCNLRSLAQVAEKMTGSASNG